MIKKLLAVRLRALFGNLLTKGKNGKPVRVSVGKVVLMTLLFLYLAIAFVGMFTAFSVSLGMTFLPLGQDDMYFGMLMLIAFSMILVLSIFETKAELFDCKDNELLMAMPIKPSHIIISRIFTVLVYNYAECAAVMLPAVVVYAFMGGGYTGVVGGLVVLATLPILATAISSAFGYVLSAISKRIKNKTLISTVLSVLFLVVYFYVYSNLLGNTSEGGSDTLTIPEIPAISFIGRAASLDPLYTVGFAAVSLFIGFLAYRIISARYISIVAGPAAVSFTEYRAKRLEKRSVRSALIRKELNRFFSSSLYIINSSIGGLFAIFTAVMLCVKGGELELVLTQIGLPKDCLYLCVIATLAMCASLNTTSASSVSLEGKGLWIIKSMPIDGRDVLGAKLITHIIVTFVPMLIASVIAVISAGGFGLELPFIIAIPLLTSLLFGLLGLVLNVALPKLEYTNDTQVIKQSMAVMFTMLAAMLWDAIMIGISVLSIIFNLVSVGYVVIMLLHLVMIAVLWILLKGPCTRKFNNL